MLKFKIEIEYKITTNIDVEDGLVKGAYGTLKFRTFTPTTNKIDKFWYNLNLVYVGKKARHLYKDLKIAINIYLNLTF